MKVIIAVDIMGGSVVRLVKGDHANKVTYSNDPVETAKKWEAVGADMLHVVDLDAAFRVAAIMSLSQKYQKQSGSPYRSQAALGH